MRVVITGARGNVGSSVVRVLAVDPTVDSMVAVTRRGPGSLPLGVAWAQADVARDDLRPLFIGADVVVHLAWLLQPSRDVATLWDVNVRGTERVLDAVAAAGVGSVVYASSVGAYSPGPEDGHRVDESWPTHGIATSPYSRAKAYTERLLDSFELRHPDLRVVRLRSALIFKAATSGRARSRFVGPLFPRALLSAGRLPVLPRVPGLVFQAVHTDDVAEAYRRAVVGTLHGAVNLAAEPVLQLGHIAEVLGARSIPVPAGFARPVVAGTHLARLHPVDVGWFDLAWSTPLLDTTRAHDELGWHPRHTARAALAEAIGGIARGQGGPTRHLQRDGPSRRVVEMLGRQGAREPVR